MGAVCRPGTLEFSSYFNLDLDLDAETGDWRQGDEDNSGVEAVFSPDTLLAWLGVM